MVYAMGGYIPGGYIPGDAYLQNSYLCRAPLGPVAPRLELPRAPEVAHAAGPPLQLLLGLASAGGIGSLAEAVGGI